MKNTDSLNQVAEFHRTFNAPILDTPQIPAPERSQLRVALLQEELDELSQAIADGNITEVADALCDLQYVLSGAVLEFGMGDKFADLFNEVHRSNMSKACNSEEEASNTVAFYRDKNVEAFAQPSGDKINVHRASDHKVLKSINYSPANLKGILEQ